MVKKKKLVKKYRKPTVKQKQDWIISQVKGFQKLLGLEQWQITCRFDGKWKVDENGYDISATIKTMANYLKAVITFHEKWVGDYFILNEELNKTILHELSHLLSAQYKRMYYDLREAYISTIRKLTEDRLTNVGESSVEHIRKILIKEFVESGGRCSPNASSSFPHTSPK